MRCLMKTEELIRALAADGSRPVTPIGRTLWRALAVGSAAVNSTLFADPASAIRYWPGVIDSPIRFQAGGGRLRRGRLRHLLRLCRFACFECGASVVVVSGPVLLAGGVVVELTTTPAGSWSERLIGHNAVHCLSLIPLLSIPSLACLFFALRRAAPLRPHLAGADCRSGVGWSRGDSLRADLS